MGNYLLYLLGQWLVFALPLRLSYAVAVFLSDVNYLFASSDRKAVMGNLRAIFPDKSTAELRAIRRRMFRNFAKYLVEFFLFPRIDAEFIRRKVRVEGLEHVDAALAKGKGVVFLTAHLGNWELGGLVMAQLRPPLYAVALKHANPKVNDFFDRRRLDKGLVVVPLGKAVKQCMQALQANKLVALVGDRDFTGKGEILPFFGKKAVFPAGPAAFALREGSALIPGMMIRQPDDTFVMHLGPPVRLESHSGDFREDVRATIREYTHTIESFIRTYPDQWFMFRRFWIE
jgi:lauroyl/myristoyl acyltransferase